MQRQKATPKTSIPLFNLQDYVPIQEHRTLLIKYSKLLEESRGIHTPPKPIIAKNKVFKMFP